MKKLILSLVMTSVIFDVHAFEYNLLSKEELLQDKLFACYDLALTEQEKQVIDALVITKNLTINNYAQRDELQEQLLDYLQQLGNDEQISHQGAQIIIKIVNDVLQLLDSSTGWVTLRASMPNDLYNTPRWHMDGSYYTPHGVLQHKFVCALQGPATLLVDVSTQLHEQFRAIASQGIMSQKQIATLSPQERNSFNMPNRQQAARLLQDVPVVTAGRYQGTIFTITDLNQAAIHSEPSIKEPRLFMAIVPGTYEQIQQWRKSREKQ